MMVQTERTYVNYMPGETRSCLGCHETPDVTTTSASRFTSPLALRRPPSKPQAQPGDVSAGKAIDYMTQIQPILDTHCLSCHGTDNPEGGVNLSSTPTTFYAVSYETLMGKPFDEVITRVGERLSVNEADRDTDNSYRAPYFSGSHTSLLVAMLSGGKILPRFAAEEPGRIKQLGDAHKDVKLSQGEFVTFVNWLDTFGQFYPSYWGLKNIGFKDHECFRPTISFEEVISTEVPEKLRDLYQNPPLSDHLNPKKETPKSEDETRKNK